MNLFRRLRHRHIWHPLKTEYRFKDFKNGKKITVKRCQCRGCGRIEYFHFDGKDILY